MARAYAGRVDLIPDVTSLMNAAEADAMMEAFIEEKCYDDSKAHLRADLKTYEHSDIVWIREEIAFALGVAIGRRLRGDRS